MNTIHPSSPRSLAIGVGALATLLAGGCGDALELNDNGANETLTAAGAAPDLSRTFVRELAPREAGRSSFGAEAASFAPSGALPTDGYFSIQRDYRRCAAPFCGGFFITALNGADVCPDVAQRADGGCYVLDIEAFSPLEDGDVVHVSSFDDAIFPGSDETPFVIASVDVVYANVLEDTYSTGSRLVFDDAGVRTVARVNTALTGTPRRLLATAQDQAALDLLVAKYNENRDIGGALTEGFLRGAQTYVVTNVWAPKNYCVFLDQEEALTAWNARTLEQAQALAAGTSATIEPGYCADKAQFCTLNYEPIFGRIDADGGVCTEFSNNCVFTASVLRAAGGARNAGKAQGTYCDDPTTKAPVCVVADGVQRYTAWNFDNRTAAEGLIASLEEEGERVTVYDGYCGDLLLPCTREFAPVSGAIDAFGDQCVEANNACGFRLAVIAAAGGAENPSKASGSYVEGFCADQGDPDECPPFDPNCGDGGELPPEVSPQQCEDLGGFAIYSPGSAISCPEGTETIGVIPVGIEGGLCCR